MALARVLSLGSGLVWSEHVIATVYDAATNSEARTVHRWGGEIIVWERDLSAPRQILRTNARIDYAIWIDERTVLFAHDGGTGTGYMNMIELRAIDEPEPRWRVKCGNIIRRLELLPDRTMFWVGSVIHSLTDGSPLEDSPHREWQAVGRFAKYRCMIFERTGESIGERVQPDGYIEPIYAPSTYVWRLECDGKTLLEYTADSVEPLPEHVSFADDDSYVTFRRAGRFVTLSLPDLTPRDVAKPVPRAPKVEAPALPKPERVALTDIATIPKREEILARWKDVESPAETAVVFEWARDHQLVVSDGDEVRLYERSGSGDGAVATVRKYIPRRAGSGHNHVIAFGGSETTSSVIALVAERVVQAESVGRTEWPIGPTTRNLRVFALSPSPSRPEPHLVRTLARRDWKDVKAKPLLAVNRDASYAAEAEIGGGTVVSVWNLETGMHEGTIALVEDDEGHVTALAFGEDGRLYLETSRARVFGYEI